MFFHGFNILDIKEPKNLKTILILTFYFSGTIVTLIDVLTSGCNEIAIS